MSLKHLLRRWLEVEPPAAPKVEKPARTVKSDEGESRLARKTYHSVQTLTRQVQALRGLVQQQGEFTIEAFRKEGAEREEEIAQQVLLQRALKGIEGGGDVIAGPWTGEVGFELLYWIPFLNWLNEEGLDGRRLVVVSRGGVAQWYRHLTSRYADVFDMMTPAEFLERTSKGKRKQYNPKRMIDQELVGRIRSELGLEDAVHLHPAVMFQLFGALWRKRATLDLVHPFIAFRPLALRPTEATMAVREGLPRDYVLVKFYFNQSFPDKPENRAFVADLLRNLTRQVPVVLLSTAVRVDDHRDFAAAAGSGLHIVDAMREPQRNLELQTDLLSGARGFVGTYGGFSYVAPFFGVRSLSFFSRRKGFEEHHHSLANRVFDRILPGGFLAVDRRASDLVEAAVSRWTVRSAADPWPPGESVEVEEDAEPMASA